MILAAGTVLLALTLAAPTDATRDSIDALPIEHVAVSDRHIVFSYAGDLWITGHEGGQARQLTAGPADDNYPAFAPDGGQVAFSRRTADDWNVYIIGTQAAGLLQLTYHPEADLVRGWTPDGSRVLFMSHRDATWDLRLYTIPAAGGFPEALPLPRGVEGAYHPAGGRLAYVPVQLPLEMLNTDWKHYRGGMASRIRIADLNDGAIERLPWEGWNDRRPLWSSAGLFFLSDRSGTFNLHRYDPESGRAEAVTSYSDRAIEDAAAADSVIAFVRDGGVHLYRPGTGEPARVPIRVPEDTTEAVRTVDAASTIQSVDVAPDADRVLFSARGELIRVEVASGAAHNLTETSGVAERYGVFAPDGSRVAYVADVDDRYELRVRSLEGGDVVRVPIELNPSFYREPVWSPDARRVAFIDKRLALWVADVETGGARRITSSTHPFQGRYQASWSPDGRWLAYSRYAANGLRQIHVYNVRTGTSEPVTDTRIHAESPIFDPSEPYLYFIGSTDAGLVGGTDEVAWSALSADLLRPMVSRRLYAAVLRPGLPGPLEGSRSGTRDPATLALEEIDRRIVPLPLPADDYESIASAGSRRLLVTTRRWPSPARAGSAPSRILQRYDLSQPEELTTLAEDVGDVVIDPGGAALYRRNGEWYVHVGSEDDAEPRRLPIEGLPIEIDVRAEWRQIFREAWRLADLYFYDPAFHGQDLEALEQRYEVYLPAIRRRQDLNRLLLRALGHLSVSHLAVGGGDIAAPEGEPSRIGLLGADYEVHRGRYRFEKIYRRPHFSDPSPLLQAPLDEPGIDIRPGDYLISVNGTPVTATRNLYVQFAGTARTRTEITVAPNPDGADARTFTVVPLPGENTLRRRHWAEENRRYVEENAGGRIGYIHVPSYGRGLEAVMRDLLAYRDRAGLIIDQRFAPGGTTADFLADWLRRDPIYYYTFRHGEDVAVPLNALNSRKVLLTNNFNASAAETFALMFKLGGLGIVIGERTAGAGIGGSTYIPELIDGGRIIIPNRAAYDPAGDWAIENRGVEPDIIVEASLADWRAGRDPYLEEAIRVLARELTRYPPAEPTRPDPPEHPTRDEGGR